MADDTVIVQIQADITDLSTKLEEMSENMHESFGEAEEASEGLGGAIEGIGEKLSTALEFAGIAVAYEAFEKLSEVMGEISEKSEHLEQTSKLYHTNTDDLQALYTAAIEAGVGTESMDRALRTLESRLQSARDRSVEMQDKLKQVGITMANLHDPGFSAAKAMERLAQSGATTGDLMDVLGPRSIIVAQAFGKLKDGMEAANEEAKKQGALNEQQITTLAEYHARMATLGLAFDNFKSALAAEVVPILYALMDAFKALFGGIASGKDVIGLFSDGMREVADDLIRVAGLAKYFADGVVGAFQLVGTALAGLAAVFTSSLGDLDNTVRVVMADVADVFDKATAKMNLDSARTVEALKKLHNAFTDFGDDGTDWEGNKEKAEKDEGKDPFKPPKPNKEEDPQLKALEIELQEAKKGSEEKIALAEAYATRSAQVYAGDVDKALEAQHKVVQAFKEAADMKITLAEDALRAQNKLDTTAFDEAQKILDNNLNAKKLTDEQWLAASEALVGQERSINETYYDQLEVLAKDDEKKLQKIAEERTAMEQKELDKLVADHKKAADDAQKQWQDMMKPIVTSFENGLQQMVNGTATFQKAIKTMMDGIVGDVFKKGIDSIVQNWENGQSQMLTSQQIMTKLGLADKTAAAAQSKAIDASTASSDITTKAAQAAAGAYNAVVGIPVIGPVLAIAAMATAEAAVMALIGKIASAEGGMMVDHDQMAMVHKDEMILPRHISQGIQERILDPSAGGGSGGSNHNTYNIHAHDAKSFDKYLSSQSSRNAIAKAVKKANTRGNRNVRGM